jgi:hypothetical protein
MQTVTKNNYTTLLQGQYRIARAVADLSLKFKALGTVSDFDRVTKSGRAFARRRRITKRAVLQDD